MQRTFLNESGDWDRATILSAVAIHARLYTAGFIRLRWDELDIDDTDFLCCIAQEAIVAYDTEMGVEEE